MTDNLIIFGTDGWRGIIDSEVDEKNIEKVAQAFSDYLIEKHNSKGQLKVAIGFDGRLYSDKFAKIFSEVLAGNSIVPFLSDKIIPTPVLSYFVKVNALDAGVMITASHNPPKYNGVKFKADYGGPFLTEETLKVEALLNKSLINTSSENINIQNFMPAYFSQLERYINFDLIKEKGIKVAIDSMAGAGQQYLMEILTNHGCYSQTIYDTADSNFLYRAPEPIEKNLTPLKNFLIENPGFSFGAATDGDADRTGILLENGEWLSAQFTILLLNDYFVNKKNIQGGLVKTSSVTDKIKLFESADRKIFDVQVGFKYICETMISQDIAIGCEESGGFGYKNHIPERDGLLSILIIAEMLAESGFNKLSDYYESKKKEFGDIYYDRIDYKYEAQDRNEKLPKLFLNPPESISDFKVVGIKEFYSSRNIVNGLKFTLEGATRWILLRSSETEPLIRFYVEAQNNNEVKVLLEAGIKLAIS